MHYLLFYDYVANAVERRAPYREEHLRLAREALGRGELLLGGAFAEPVDGAALLFRDHPLDAKQVAIERRLPVPPLIVR